MRSTETEVEGRGALHDPFQLVSLAAAMRPFYVYILRCYDASLYVGHTDNLEARVAQHAAGAYDSYTAERRPVELVFSQECATRDEAFRAERKLKNWSRAKKLALIARDWHALHLHARSTEKRLRDGD